MDTRAEFLEAVMLEYGHLLSILALRLTKNEADAQDLLQETYLKIWRFYGKFQAGTNLKAWACKILQNTWRNDPRKAKMRKGTRVDFEKIARTLAAPEMFLDDYASLGEAVEGMHKPVQDALGGIPEIYRDAVLLADVAELSYAEIATFVGCPVGTVMSRVFRGRERLGKALATYAHQEYERKENNQ